MGKSPSAIIQQFEPQLINEYKKLEQKFGCELSFLIKKENEGLVIQFLTEDEGKMKIIGSFYLKEFDKVLNKNEIEQHGE